MKRNTILLLSLLAFMCSDKSEKTLPSLIQFRLIVVKALEMVLMF